MKKILNHLFENKSFSRPQAQKILTSIAMGEYNNAQIAAFITAYGMRNITVQELQGFRDAMLDLCVKLDFSDYELIDLCGTGGDGKDTFNISTLASFVLAGTGNKVAKHGNYGVSSGCGSSNVMEYLGYTFSNDQDVLRRNLDEAGICFIHAPLFNPAMKIVAPIRKELGVKTFFNMLGPMCNPARPKNQLVGVFSLELARLYAYLYQETGNNYTILHALDGFDEISLTCDIKTFSKKGEAIIKVSDLGFETISEKEIKGGDSVASSAKIFTDILEGKGSDAQNNVVLCNAALALQTINGSRSFGDCFYEAEAPMELKLKICGMREKQNIAEVAELGPDYMGFIFYPGSKRYAADLTTELPQHVKKTGVFVNQPIGVILEYILKYKLSAIQLHGNESPAYCAQFKELAFKEFVDYFLLDTQTAGHGGSGKLFNWKLLELYHLDTPYFLSGGIGPQQVQLIKEIQDNRLYAVDINSRFELEPGLKNIDQLREFKNKLFH
eukprot:gene16859-20233_t